DINWGDGTGTQLAAGHIVAGDDGSFSVYGSHTYAEESGEDGRASSRYCINVRIHHEHSATQTVFDTATVSDPHVIATGGQTISAVEGHSTGPVLLATFTDPGGPEAISDYSADINWGDGTGTQVAAGHIVANEGGSFSVYSHHTYAEESG